MSKTNAKPALRAFEDAASTVAKVSSAIEAQQLARCARLAVLALQAAAAGEPVRCGRCLSRLEHVAIRLPYAQSIRAFTLSTQIEAYANEQWIKLAARRSAAIRSSTLRRLPRGV